MKKLKLFLFACLILVFAGSFNTASAIQFDLDLSTIDANYGTYTDIFRINVDGFAEVNQSFGADLFFNENDTFTETTILQEISYKTSLTGTNIDFDPLDDEAKVMYLYGTGLTGKAVNISFTDIFDLETYIFDYVFDPGVGSIGIYIDDDTGSLAHNAATAELVASFELVSGDGAADDGFLGGLVNAGSTRLTGEFLDGTPDNVWLANGLDLGNLPAGYSAFAQLNTTNQVVIGPDTYGSTFIDHDNDPATDEIEVFQGFNATINSTGHMDVSVVPEPTTMILFGVGLLGLAGVSRKRFVK